MNSSPNVLIFLTDAMQAETVRQSHPCLTPNFEQLAERGVNFTRAHTVCPTCSPARASLMTGLLPHNHGVLEVEHGRDADQCNLREDKPHWVQKLAANGYRTGYFGKWHIERSGQLERFGWQTHLVKGAEHVRGLGRGDQGPQQLDLDESLCGFVDGHDGYNRVLHFGVTDIPIEQRYPALTVADALRFLKGAASTEQPWCCCVSFSEPNEALIVGRETYERYDLSTIELPANFRNDFSDRPALYRRQQRIGEVLSEAHWKAARACYFGRITELDDQFGRLMSYLEKSDQLENTIVIVLSDHGRYVGAHGFDAHNCGPFEEIYRIPLILAGPGIATGADCEALVSIADLCPTLCELTESEIIDTPDSDTFADLLRQPSEIPPAFRTGYAEYHGTRFPLCQRILWQDRWKFVFNGFDFDELYDLEADPYEMTNLAEEPTQAERIRSMMSEIWRRVRDTGDRTLFETHYFSMRFAAIGPNAADRL